MWRFASLTVAVTGLAYVLVFLVIILCYHTRKALKSTRNRQRFAALRNKFSEVHRHFAVLRRYLQRHTWGKIVILLVEFLAFPVECTMMIIVAYPLWALLLSAPWYCFCRVYLVVESFINLAHLSESVLTVPTWSQYIPHFT